MIDILVIATVALAALSGWRKGLIAAVLGAAGWLVGLVLGIRYVQPFVAANWSPAAPYDVLLQGAAVLLTGALTSALLQALARGLLRGPRGAGVRPFRAVDSLAGAAVLGIAAAFVVSAATTIAQPALSPAAARSLDQARTLSALDDAMPAPAREVISTARHGVETVATPLRVLQG